MTTIVGILKLIPPIERLVSYLWSGYEKWKTQHDMELMAQLVAKAKTMESTKEINEELAKK